jgi:hypothetical protein
VPLRRGDMAALDAGLIDYHPKPPPLPPRQRTRSAHVD